MMRKFLVAGLWFATALAAVLPGAARPAAPRPSAVAPDRLEALSRRYLGVPYKLDCLGEGSGADADPLFTRDYADCQTLVEQVLAEAIAGSPKDLDAAVRQVRYQGSRVSLETRLHYCIPDWITQPWPARDISANVGGASLQFTRRTIDRAALLEPRLGGRKLNIPVQTVATGYIPRASVADVESRIPHGSIGMFVLDNPNIVIGHLGFLFRKDGTLLLRHASQTRKQVIDEPLSDYLARAPKRFIGLKVLLPDVAGLQRATAPQKPL